jgi:hypothetical protein
LEPFAPEDEYYGPLTLAARSLLDRREIVLLGMMFNLRVAITDGPRGMSYEDGYCFHVEELAWLAFETWDGESVPKGFAKNPFTGVYGDCPCQRCRRIEMVTRELG